MRDVYPAGGVRLLLQKQCKLFGGIRPWARAHKVSAAYVSRTIRGEKPPAKKILDALCLEESTVYVPKQRRRTDA